MPEKDPSLWTWATWLPIALMASAGGVVNWLLRVRSKPSRFSVVELIGELFTSGFVGIGTAMLLASLGYDFLFCAASAGITGHMATRLLYRIEHIILSRIDAMESKRRD